MKKRMFYSISALALLLGVSVMGISDVGKVCLFSAMSGVITLDGKPVANARLVRTADRDGAKTDETTTDNNGNFKFPAVFERTITKYLPQEFVVKQVIQVQYQGKEYAMWSGVKRKPEENAESSGKPLVVKCELNQEKQFKQVDYTPIISLCTWDVESDPPMQWTPENLFEPGT
jgi:hypothetical protein